MNDFTKNLVTKAEGYLELGMHEDAWSTLDSLEASEQRRASVRGLRAQILIASKSWIKAEIFAGSIVSAIPDFALGWYVLAQAYAQQGKIAPAQEALKKATTTDEKFKRQALIDPLLTSVW